jgi:hypothetical protein
MQAQAATACLPGKKHYEAVAAIHLGIYEPMLGRLGHADIQLCPQHPTPVGDALVERLLSDFPDTRFRLHASVRLHGDFEPIGAKGRRIIHDAAFVDNWRWFKEAARISTKLGATAYTVHAGRRENASLQKMADNVRQMVDLFNCRVGVEGLYPERDIWLIQDWAEYAWLLESGLDYALDLSHLNIVARKSGSWEKGLVKEMLSCERCIEVHLSDNDGLADRHLKLNKAPYWWDLIDSINANAVVFSEGSQRG